MYEFIFESRLVTSMAALLAVLLACGLAASIRLWWRVLAFNFVPAIACGFYVAALFADANRSVADTAMSLLFEFVVLCIFCRMLFLAFEALHTLRPATATRTLLATTMLYVATIVPSLLGSGFGIFSEGTRIDYLYESAAAKYLTYAAIMIGVVQAGLLARRITLHSRPYLLDYALIGLISLMSIVAGSKGGFLLWIASILALIDYRAARIRATTIVVAGMAVAAAIAGLVIVVADFLRLTTFEFFDLAFNRFFVTNDARAMAMDFRPLGGDPGTGLLTESFRSLSRLFGSGPRDAPLGSQLYDLYFGDTGGAGGNASFTALTSFYSAPGYAALPLLIATCAAIAFAAAFAIAYRRMDNGLARYVIAALGTVDISLLAQDFLAFQLVLPLTVVVAFCFFAFGKTYGRPLPAPS